MKRTKLRERILPVYSRGEDCMNMVTHIVGGGIGLLILVACLLRARNGWDLLGSWVYGSSMLFVYTISSVYHGLRPGMGKKVLQVLDHCAIYTLIAGTYTPILLSAMVPAYPGIGWGLLVWQWGLAILAVTLTAIDLKRYKVFSMVCYIGMGWSILAFLPQARAVLGSAGFGWLLAGGIVYTIGAVIFGIGSKVRWMHSVFHIFVVAGSVLQAVAVIWYVL